MGGVGRVLWPERGSGVCPEAGDGGGGKESSALDFRVCPTPQEMENSPKRKIRGDQKLEREEKNQHRITDSVNPEQAKSTSHRSLLLHQDPSATCGSAFLSTFKP